MRVGLFFATAALVAAASAFAADASPAQDGGWKKLQDLRAGTELKVFERGEAQPRAVKFADATEKSLIVIVKNAQVAIAREKIDRIDYRPPKKPTVSKTTKMDEPGTTNPGPQGPNTGPALPESGEHSYSSSAAVSFDTAGFQTIYRRPPPARP